MLQQLRRNGEVVLMSASAIGLAYSGMVAGREWTWFLLCFEVLILGALLFQTREELVALRDDVDSSE